MSLELVKSQFYNNKKGWIKSYNSGLCQDENGNFLPWMCYPAIDFLNKNVKKTDIIFEFGLGTSTLFFAKKAKMVFALETRKDWFENMKKIFIANKIDNYMLILMTNGLENSNYETFPQKILENKYRKYADEIFCAPNLEGDIKNLVKSQFDLIVIDSLKRRKSAENSAFCLAKNGKILLDDSQRSNYGKIYEKMSELNFNNLEFKGISPAQIKIKKTTVFYKKL